MAHPISLWVLLPILGVVATAVGLAFRSMSNLQRALVTGALGIHLAGFWFMGRLPKEKKYDSVAIALAEAKKKPEPPKKDQPPPPKVDPPKTPEAKQAKAAPNPEPKLPEAAPPPPANAAPANDGPPGMEGFQDLGLALGGGGGGGMAVPTGGGRGSGPATPQPTATQKTVKALAPVAADECSEELVKPTLDHQVQPAYSQEARAASIEGVVKLELTIDASGHVVGVKVVKGLGYGLDEAAVAAAKQWTFKPATKCGKPVASVVKPGVRFELGS
jgi:protein TonB